jgi:hypothetical protein
MMNTSVWSQKNSLLSAAFIIDFIIVPLHFHTMHWSGNNPMLGKTIQYRHAKLKLRHILRSRLSDFVPATT